MTWLQLAAEIMRWDAEKQGTNVTVALKVSDEIFSAGQVAFAGHGNEYDCTLDKGHPMLIVEA